MMTTGLSRPDWVRAPAIAPPSRGRGQTTVNPGAPASGAWPRPTGVTGGVDRTFGGRVRSRHIGPTWPTGVAAALASAPCGRRGVGGVAPTYGGDGRRGPDLL